MALNSVVQTEPGESGDSQSHGLDTTNIGRDAQISGYLEAAYSELSASLSNKLLQDFRETTFDKLCLAIGSLQIEQENYKRLMNLTRLQGFLEAFEQFGKAFEVYWVIPDAINLIWGSMKFLLLTASIFLDSFDTLLGAYERVGEALAPFMKYQSLLDSRPVMINAIGLVCADILIFHRHILPFFTGNSWMRFFRPNWKDFGLKFRGILSRLHRHADLMKTPAAVASDQQYDQDMNQLSIYGGDLLASDNLLEAEIDAKQQRERAFLRDWLRVESQRGRDHTDILAIRQGYPTTGRWILNREVFQDWMSREMPNSMFLWITGMPGAGKTVLTSVITEELIRGSYASPYPTSYYYCNKQQSAVSIVSELLYQLLNQFPRLLPYCYYRASHSGQARLASWTLAKTLLEHFCELIPKLYIVIDGLDQCDIVDRRQLLDLLMGLIDRNNPAKRRILVVSQDYPDIRRSVLRESSDVELVPQVLSIQPSDNEGDIRVFVEKLARKIQAKLGLSHGEIEVVQDLIVNKAHGMFLYASSYMSHLLVQSTRQELLEELRLQHCPTALTETYERIITYIQQTSNPYQWLMVEKLLGLVVCSKRPLTWTEIQVAVSLNLDTQELEYAEKRLRTHIYDSCSPLVSLSADRVQLVHGTAESFLTENARFIDKPAAECEMAVLCLQYLTFPCFHKNVDEEALMRDALDGHMAFQDYVIAHWSDHINAFVASGHQLLLDSSDTPQPVEDFQIALDDFCDTSADDLRGTSIVDECKTMCEDFEGQKFYDNLVKLASYIHISRSAGSDAQHSIRMKRLAITLERNRVLLEQIPKKASEEDMATYQEFYGERRFKCPYVTCIYFSEGFREAKARRKHVNMHDRPFQCSVIECIAGNTGFSNSKDLERHLRSFHPEQSELARALLHVPQRLAAGYTCRTCGKNFTRSFHRDNHERSHRGNRPHVCPDCGKAFTRQMDLKHHQKLHERPEDPKRHQQAQDFDRSQQFSPTRRLPSFNLFTVDAVDLGNRARTSQQPLVSHSHAVSSHDDLKTIPSSILERVTASGFSDSGYGSLAPELSVAHSTAQLAVKASVPLGRGSHAEQSGLADSSSDPGSVYSDATSVRASTKDQYIEDLVEDLFDSVVMNRASDGVLLGQLYSTLSGLLKAFARTIGLLGESRQSREVMVFVSKHRETIVSRLQARLKIHEAKAPGADVSAREKVDSWFDSKQSNPDSDNDDLEDFSTGPVPIRQSSEGLEDTSVDEAVHNRNVECKPDGAPPDRRRSNPQDFFVGVKDFDEADSAEEEPPLNLPPYRDYVSQSPAYFLLLSRIHREMALSNPSPNIMRSISDQIRSELSRSEHIRKLSRGIAPHLCAVGFVVKWAVIEFLQDQMYEEQPELAFAKVITLTGTYGNAQALSVEQYVRQTWPLTGIGLIEALKDAIKAGPLGEHTSQHVQLKDGTTIQANIAGVEVRLNAVGTSDGVSEIGEQLAWLGAAMRNSLKEKGLDYSSPFIQDLRVGERPDGQIVASICLDFSTGDLEGNDTSESNGQCWRALFRNPTVVRGFPVQSRTQENTGIEMPLNMMASLIGATRIINFGCNTLIKSFNAILILTGYAMGMAHWHVLLNDREEHICYTDPRIRDLVEPRSDSVHMHLVQSARHVLGWCSSVSSLTGSPSANYSIRWSELPKTRPGCAFEKVTIMGGQFISAGASFLIGKKDSPIIFSARNDYLSQLRWISNKFFVFYDVADRRAWMADGVSALLHLVRASLKHNEDDGFADHFLFKSDDLIEATCDRIGKAAAIAVLTNEQNQNIWLHQKPNDSHDEQTIKGADVNTVKKQTTSYYCFKDRVDHIYHLLEQMVAHQSQVESQDGVGFKVKGTPRKQLEGFEFMELASDEDPLWPRVATLTSAGVGWVDFARALHAPTLFGRDFGSLFKASDTAIKTCAHWSEVPKGHDYLTASASDLKEILKKRGSTTSNPWILIDDIRWHNPDKIFGPCQKRSRNQTAVDRCCERVQVLVPSSFPSLWARKYRSPAKLEDAGAIIFGHNRKLPLRWGDSGDPEDAEPLGASADILKSPSDSGIGSSIGSTVSSVHSDPSQPSATSSTSEQPSRLSTVGRIFQRNRQKRQKVDDAVRDKT